MSLNLTKNNIRTLVTGIISPLMNSNKKCRGSYLLDGLHQTEPVEMTNLLEAKRKATIQRMHIEHCPLFEVQGFGIADIVDETIIYNNNSKSGRYRDVECPGREACMAAVKKGDIEIILD